MKKALIITAIGIAIVAGVLFFEPFQSNAALDDSLEACWTMDETSGTRADSSANGNDLSDNNTVGSAAGKVDTAADFERDNSEYLSITDANQTGLDITGDMSVVFWFDADNAQDDATVFSKFTASDRSYIYRIYTSRSTDDICAVIGDGDGDGTSSFGGCAAGDNVDTSGFYFVTMVYDASAGEVEYFLDATSIETDSGFPTSIWDSGEEVEVGARSGGAEEFDGLVDELGIWSRKLTSSEITSIYNSGNGTSCDDLGAAAATTPVGKIKVFE